jgi:NAD(P)-dependent dehydrogenase (short-subunit alcohol dehydrogenase family)/putative sterol carrier protein/acyl dehydratase
LTNKLFDGRVVIVTGSGGGIGRSHALAFAKEGAKVVVNDLGSSMDGSGQTQKMADKVVEEIKASGGTAVANYDSVSTMEGAKNIVKTAIDNFGTIDIVINNAGILRDKTMLKMTEDMWDIVVAVHLKGTFAVSHAAAPYMKDKGYGRIINTTSFAGLMGNFGQANYSAAKAGIYGFTKTLAMELERYNVFVNAIAPLAKTRMTEDIDAVPEDFKPEDITPMVMYLGSDKCQATGKIFGIHGLQLFEYKMQTNQGIEKTSPWSVSEIHDKLEGIMKFEESASTGGSADLGALLPKLNQVLAEVGLQVTGAGAPGAPAAVPTEVTLSDMFQKMAEVFLPDKAADFKGLIQFEISGDTPQALYIENKAITIKAEKGSNPACTITTDKGTMTDVFKGKLDINKAFMKGKVKADKMPVLMKFGNMLALNKLPPLIEAMVPAAPAGAPTGEMTLSDMFQKMTEVFLPEKAGDFKGLIQFELSGDSPQAIYIDNGTITIKAEKGSNPACTITTDKDTMTDVFKGKLDINKAFMKGKVKADKMPVLMKFGNMLALNKLPEKIASSQTQVAPKAEGKAPAEKPSPATAVGSLKSYMQKFTEVFNPEKVETDQKINFTIAGDENYAFYIQNKAVTIKAEKISDPTLTITTDKETMVAMLSGELHPNKAFMKRKLKADKMPLLMKFNQMFNLEKLGELLKADIADEIASAPVPGEGMNRDYIGRKFHGSAQHVKPEDSIEYSKATNEKNKIYYKDDPKELAIHPLFPVTLMKNLVERILLEDDLNMDVLRMVHGGHEIKYFRPLKAWDLVYTTAEITEINRVSSGEIMNAKIYGKDRGLDVFEMTGTFFVRGKSKKKDKGDKKPDPEPTGKKIFEVKMKVDPDQSKRYAKASGDDNPIHLDPETAKAAGLPDIILHGLCSMAFCSQAVVENIAGGDPTKLEQISVRFSKVVLMNDELTTTGWLQKEENGKKYLTFETTNQRNEKVITAGTATIVTK